MDLAGSLLELFSVEGLSKIIGYLIDLAESSLSQQA